MDTNKKEKIIKLKEPVLWGSDTITEITLKKPTIGDIQLMNLEKPTLKDLLEIASKLSAQPQKLINLLSVEDGLEVVGAVGEWLGSSQKIGSILSEQ